jgi:hypothetical protein
MVISRSCKADNKDGARCGAAPLQDGEFCYMHTPENADAMQEARRVGGLRKRREGTLEVIYEVDGMETVPQLRRILKIAVMEALGLENNAARIRLLLNAVAVGAKLLETGELADQIAELRGVLEVRLPARKGRR